MSKSANPYQMAQQMAQFKFGLIAPVLQNTYSEASAMAYYRRVTEEPLNRPDGTSYQYKAKTLQHWERLYRQGGMDALITKERKDKGISRALSNNAILEIYNLREKFPKLNATQIRLKLLSDGVITAKVSVRCVQRFVTAWNLKVGSPAINLKDRKAFEEEYFGGMWQADSCFFPHIPNEKGVPSRTYLILIIDDHSRLIVGALLFFQDNAVNLQSLLKKAVATYGIPNKFYCDHGSPYISHQTEFICASIGTVLIHAPVRDSAAKGKVERVFGTIKEGFLYGTDVSAIGSLAEFNEKLSDFIRKYNLTVHSSTQETPMDRYLKTRDRIKVPKSREWLQECFLHRIKRKVHNDSTLKIDNESYDAPMQFIGQYVEVRFDPNQPENAFIFYNEKRFPLRKTNKVENSRTKRDRDNNLKIDYSQPQIVKGDDVDV